MNFTNDSSNHLCRIMSEAARFSLAGSAGLFVTFGFLFVWPPFVSHNICASGGAPSSDIFRSSSPPFF